VHGKPALASSSSGRIQQPRILEGAEIRADFHGRATRNASRRRKGPGEPPPLGSWREQARFSARKRIKRNTLRCTSSSSVDIGYILTHLRRISRVRVSGPPSPPFSLVLCVSPRPLRLRLRLCASWFCGTLCSLFSFLPLRFSARWSRDRDFSFLFHQTITVKRCVQRGTHTCARDIFSHEYFMRLKDVISPVRGATSLQRVPIYYIIDCIICKDVFIIYYCVICENIYITFIVFHIFFSYRLHRIYIIHIL